MCFLDRVVSAISYERMSFFSSSIQMLKFNVLFRRNHLQFQTFFLSGLDQRSRTASSSSTRAGKLWVSRVCWNPSDVSSSSSDSCQVNKHCIFVMVFFLMFFFIYPSCISLVPFDIMNITWLLYVWYFSHW